MPTPCGDFPLALALSGGNALGAYQAGAYQALLERDLEPDWVAGASAGAINGAIICGNPPELRVERLRDLWRPSLAEGTTNLPAMVDEARRASAAMATLAGGAPDLFLPRHMLGPWWNPFGNPEPASLYDTTPLRHKLDRLIDFDLLNAGKPRFSAAAVDVVTGEDVVFDTTAHRLDADHLRASSALIPAFSPVEIGERLLCDAGISANLPLDGFLSETHDGPLLCIALDLLPLHGPRPRTLGETMTRMQDLLFATQSRRAIAAWQAIFDERERSGRASSVTILHISYSDQAREVSGKAFDFSPDSAGVRWQAGGADLGRALDDLDSGRISVGEPGMSVYAVPYGGRHLEKVRRSLKPERG